MSRPSPQETPMPPTVLYAEGQPVDDALEGKVFGSDIRVMRREVGALADLAAADCADVAGLMISRLNVSAADMDRFPKLRVILRMGVGYDRLARDAAAERQIIVCNVPDYGTTEVADHALALVLALRRGIIQHHDAQRRTPPPVWRPIPGALVRRASVQRFGILGLGRIGTAAALRARAFGFRVVFYDPYLPNGAELALGIDRAATLEDLLRQSDVLSIHTPLTRETRGMLGLTQLKQMPRDAVIVNTARGPVIDIDALEVVLREGHLAGAGLDVVPVEPPVEPLPALVQAYRAREPWLEGRLVVTPHAAYYSPESQVDTRVKSAETMRAALLTNRPRNVITPEMD
jgi:C-terminal binding protein